MCGGETKKEKELFLQLTLALRLLSKSWGQGWFC